MEACAAFPSMQADLQRPRLSAKRRAEPPRRDGAATPTFASLGDQETPRVDDGAPFKYLAGSLEVAAPSIGLGSSLQATEPSTGLGGSLQAIALEHGSPWASAAVPARGGLSHSAADPWSAAADQRSYGVWGDSLQPKGVDGLDGDAKYSSRSDREGWFGLGAACVGNRLRQLSPDVEEEEEVEPVLTRVLSRGAGDSQEAALHTEIAEGDSLSSMLARVLARGYAARRALMGEDDTPEEDGTRSVGRQEASSSQDLVAGAPNKQPFRLDLHKVEENRAAPTVASARGAPVDLQSPNRIEMSLTAENAITNWPLSARSALQRAGSPMQPLLTMPRVMEDPQESRSSSEGSESSSSRGAVTRGQRSVSPAPASIPNLDLSKVQPLQLQRPSIASARIVNATKETVALLSSRNGTSAAPATPGGLPGPFSSRSPAAALDSMGRTKETLAILSARASGAPVSPLFTMSSLMSARTGRCMPEAALPVQPLTSRGRTASRPEQQHPEAACAYYSARIRTTQPQQQPDDPLGHTKATMALLSARNGGALQSARRSISTPPPAGRPVPEAEEDSGGHHHKPSSQSNQGPPQKPSGSPSMPEAIPALDMSRVNFGRPCRPPGAANDPLVQTKKVVEMLSARHAGHLNSARRSLSLPPRGAE